MKFTLKNIGLIKNSEIRLNGLTVITGHNNSGKTTVGKALYACIEGISEIEEKYEEHKNNYIQQTTRRFIFVLTDIKELFKKYARKKQFNEYSGRIKQLIQTIEHLFAKDTSLRQDTLTFINFLETNELVKLLEDKSEDLLLNIRHSISSLQDDILNNLDKMINYSITEFVKDNLNFILRTEFSKQIQPVKNKTKALVSEIKITDDKNLDTLNLSISNNNIVNNKSTYKYVKYDNVFLIDNPFVIDELDEIAPFSGLPSSLSKFMFDDMFLDNKFNHDDTSSLHNEKLKLALATNKYTKNIFEKGLDKDLYKNINQVFNNAIPGTIRVKRRERGFEYVHDNYSLNLSNLATGTKLFAIMKTLIDKGAIDDNTILILDEPESHLHPEWQNIFAELLVLLVKDVNCRILLTTHSPNFLLAIEAFMYKYNIKDKCNFYKTQFNDDKETVDYVLTNNTNEIYGEFVKFLSQVKKIRNTYAHYKEDIDDK